jgi:hypothetical protein
MIDNVDRVLIFPSISGEKLYSGRTLSEMMFGKSTPVASMMDWLLSYIQSILISTLLDAIAAAVYADETLWDLCSYDLTTSIMIADSVINVSHRIEERSSATFDIRDDDGDLTFEPGQEVIIWVLARSSAGRDYLFGGMIDPADGAQVIKFSKAYDARKWVIRCTDYHYITDNKLYTAAFEAGATGGQIVRDIMLQELEEEGITEGIIQEGETLQAQTFNVLQCTEALDNLAELCGFTWFISAQKKMYFMDRATYEAEWSISDGSEIEFSDLTVTLGNGEYRNVQVIKGSDALTAERTEYFKGNGVQKSFTLGFPCAKEPTASVGSVAQTVGIRGVESDKDWYWNEGSNVIMQNDDANPLSGDETLSVTYIGSYKLMVRVRQSAEETDWKIKNGFGTGKVEKVYEDFGLVDIDSAIEVAKQKLLHLSHLGKRINYNTRKYGLAAGVLQTVNYPSLGLDDEEMLISSIEFNLDALGARCSVDAVSGPVDGSWEKYFVGMARLARAKDQSVGGSDIAQGLESFTKTWESADRPNPFVKIYPSDATFPHNIDFPCFEEGDELKYLVLYTDGVEFFRKAIVMQTIEAGQINTTAILLSGEANRVLISHVGLWGGNLCTTIVGSGIEMEKFAYVKTKNSLESLQFDFEDIKDW